MPTKLPGNGDETWPLHEEVIVKSRLELTHHPTSPWQLFFEASGKLHLYKPSSTSPSSSMNFQKILVHIASLDSPFSIHFILSNSSHMMSLFPSKFLWTPVSLWGKDKNPTAISCLVSLLSVTGFLLGSLPSAQLSQCFKFAAFTLTSGPLHQLFTQYQMLFPQIHTCTTHPLSSCGCASAAAFQNLSLLAPFLTHLLYFVTKYP